MPKKVIQDMQSKGVRITRITRSTKSQAPKQIEVAPDVVEDFHPVKDEVKMVDNYIEIREPSSRIPSTPRVKGSSFRLRKSFKLLLFLSVLVALVFFISNKFENTTITITQKHATYSLTKESFTASSLDNAALNFELMIASDTEAHDMVLTDHQDVSIKAHGEITLYNEYSTKAQSLSIHSFVSDSSGKTYVIDKAVSIPGYKTQAGKITPGQATVGITSFLPGDSYNGTPSDFSVNIFKGTAKAKKIYGKLKSPLVGGAQGVVYKPTPQDLGTLNAVAQSTFKSALLKKVVAEVPPGYIMYPDAVSFTYKVDENILSPTPNAKVKISGTVSTVILNEKDLTRALIKDQMPNVGPLEQGEIVAPDISSLKFNFNNPNVAVSKDTKQLGFNLSGNVEFIWKQDIEALKSKVANMPKTDLPSIFKADPGIVEAYVKVFPPWQKYVSSDASKIKVIIN